MMKREGWIWAMGALAVMSMASWTMAADPTTTTKILRAPLKGEAAQADAKGLAEHRVVEVTNGSTKTTTVFLVVGVEKLKLPDGAEVGFGAAGKPLGKAKVKSGKAMIKLSTEKGDKIPKILPGDGVDVVNPTTKAVLARGKFAPPPPPPGS